MKNWRFTRGDLSGGFAAGLASLPLALAFGFLSGLGVIAGLCGAVFLGFVATLFGSNAPQISGPTGTQALVAATATGFFVSQAGTPELAIAPVVACFVLAGAIQLLMGITRIGTLIQYIPYPVQAGLMSGIGVIVILYQLLPAIGQASPVAMLSVIGNVNLTLKEINGWALLYTTLTIAVIYIAPRLTRSIPGMFVALLSITILAFAIGKDVPLIGELPAGLPAFRGKSLFSIPPGLYLPIAGIAVLLALLGAVDSLLTASVTDRIAKTRHNSNRELIGQGIGNTVAGLFAGLPGAGSVMRTLINIRHGGRNRTAGLIQATVLLVVLLTAVPYIKWIPQPVLAGILIVAGIGMLDYKGLTRIGKMPATDAIMMIVVLLSTVLLNLLIAAAAAVLITIGLLLLKRRHDPGKENTETSIAATDELLPGEISRWVLVQQIDSSLLPHSVKGFQSLINKPPGIRYVILRMEKIHFVDQPGLSALEESVLALGQKGIEVILTGVQEQPLTSMNNRDIIPGLIAKEHVFASLADCTKSLSAKIKL